MGRWRKIHQRPESSPCRQPQLFCIVHHLRARTKTRNKRIYLVPCAWWMHNSWRFFQCQGNLDNAHGIRQSNGPFPANWTNITNCYWIFAPKQMSIDWTYIWTMDANHAGRHRYVYILPLFGFCVAQRSLNGCIQYFHTGGLLHFGRTQILGFQYFLRFFHRRWEWLCCGCRELKKRKNL